MVSILNDVIKHENIIKTTSTNPTTINSIISTHTFLFWFNPTTNHWTSTMHF